MHNTLKDIIKKMLLRNIIGGKHVPEMQFLNHFIRHLPKSEQKAIWSEYYSIRDCFIRLKKRTGKGSEWHISINPKERKKLLSYL